VGAVAELAERLRARAVSSRELVDASLRRAEATASLNAFVCLDPDGARAAAAQADDERARGIDRGPLHGVPVAIKDNLHVAGLPTTCASRILAGFVPRTDATAVGRLRAAGAIVMGKTNLDEFAMGSSTEHSAFGPVRNPVDEERVAGGSSGGSAAAVAAGVVPIALGSDTGGSVRQPAAFCGVVGLRPTWGSVSRSGLVAFASSLDQVGPIAADVESAQLVLEVLASPDPADATATRNLGPAAEPGRIGLITELADAVPPAGRSVLDRAVAALGGAEPVSLPSTRFAAPAYYVLASAEAASNLARFDGVRYGARVHGDSLAAMIRSTRTEGFGREVQRRVLLGNFVLSAGHRDAYYRRGLAARDRLRAEFDALFRRVDLLISLTAPETAFPVGSRPDPVAMYRSDLLTIPAALAGLPAVSVPVPGPGLPWGVQLMGPAGADRTVLAAARRLEAALR